MKVINVAYFLFLMKDYWCFDATFFFCVIVYTCFTKVVIACLSNNHEIPRFFISWIITHHDDHDVEMWLRNFYFLLQLYTRVVHKASGNRFFALKTNLGSKVVHRIRFLRKWGLRLSKKGIFSTFWLLWVQNSKS